MPESGTYFITNVASGEAMQPAAASAGQNVLTYEYNQGGLQKWVLKRKIDAATKKPTNRYNIRLAGEATDLNFQPHPISDATAIISSDESVFTLEPTDSGLVVKSIARNGDALYIVPSPPMNTETHFGPNDGSTKFRWKFTATN